MAINSRKIIFSSIVLTFLTIAIIFYSFYTGRDIAERHYPLIDAVMEIKVEVTNAHLGFVELINDNKSLSIQNVWEHLDKSEWYANAMLNGGSSKQFKIVPIADIKLRSQIKDTIKCIHHFRQMAKDRWESKSISNIGSFHDEQFEIAFSTLISSANNIKNTLETTITNDAQAFTISQLILTLLVLIIGVSVGFILINYNTRQISNIEALKVSKEIANKSEEQLQNIINGAKLGYWDWNFKTGEHFVNNEWLNILGLTYEDIEQNVSDWESRIHPSDKEYVNNIIQTHIQTGKTYIIEFRMQHKYGHWVWIQGAGSVVKYDDITKEPLRLCGTHQDITNQKKIALRDKSRTRVLEFMTSDSNLFIILDAIVRDVEYENPNMLCSILLLDETGEHLLIGASPNLPDFYNEAIDGIEIGVGVGSCGTAAFTNMRVIVEDIQNHPYWEPYKELAKEAGLGACWSEPIRSSKGKVLGTFAIYHREPNQPSLEHISLIEQSASLASIAIEKTQAKASLEARDEQMQLVLAGADLGFWDWNILTGAVERNERWATMLGYTHEELKNSTKQWSDFIYPDDLDKAWQSIDKVMKGTATAHDLEYRMLTKDGGIKWIHDKANVMKRDDDGKPLRMSGTHSDISDRKVAEEKLELAASVFTHASESIIITNTEGLIIDVNDTFIKSTGYSREESIGRNPRFLQSNRHPPEYYSQMWHTINNEGNWHGEIWNRRKNGELYAEMKTISAVCNEKGVTTHYVALGNDITEKVKQQNQLERIAHYDVLTHLPNRVLLADRLSQAMLHCTRNNLNIAVVFLDLDGFKVVNDTYGHDMGDDLLITLSGRMQKALREGDSLARIGGDEFVAVLTDLHESTYKDDCLPVLDRLLDAASEPITINETVLNVSASIGVTLYPEDNVNSDQLMRHADQAMYIAKESGKNRYHFFDMAQDVAVKVQRESIDAIRDALTKEQLVLFYQPKVNMKTGMIIGFEALIRWQHPERGLLSPIEFLPMIENNPLIIDIGEWVIETALSQICQWQKMSSKFPLHISVNIAGIQIQQADFKQKLTTILKAHPNVDPSCLELEILETSALDDVQHASNVMNECKDLGVKFALDDFGTGYSSLTYLRRLPASIIKIDQSFVRDMLNDTDDMAIVEGIIALAKSFKRDVIAEGVETIEHGTQLLKLGCHWAQGYGIAKPMPASEIETWMSNWQPDKSWTINIEKQIMI